MTDLLVASELDEFVAKIIWLMLFSHPGSRWSRENNLVMLC